MYKKVLSEADRIHRKEQATTRSWSHFALQLLDLSSEARSAPMAVNEGKATPSTPSARA